jgi:hypothetical protein
MIKLTETQAKAIFFQDYSEFKTVESSDWDDYGKYQIQEIIFSHEEKHYSLSVERHGSYSSGYDYYYELDCSEVEQIEITTKVWVGKKT